MHPPYKITLQKLPEVSAVPALLALFAGDFARMEKDEDGKVTLTTPTRAVAINVVQILVAEDVSFSYDAGE